MRIAKTTTTGKLTSNLETLNFRLPKEVVGILDTLVKKGLFSNRSEAVREFCRDYVKEQRTTTKITGAHK